MSSAIEIGSFNVKLLSSRPLGSQLDEQDLDLENGSILLSSSQQNIFYTNFDLKPLDKVLLEYEESESVRSRVVAIFFTDSISESNDVYVCPQLWFNLRLNHVRKDSTAKNLWKYPLIVENAVVKVRPTN